MKALKLRSNSYSGKLIVFEGTDGAGKTTLIEKTRQYLTELYGFGQVLTVKQPTDLSRKTKLFQKMMYCADHNDVDYRAVQLLTMSDRVQHGYEVIEPALKAGKTVISNRYIYTSLANMTARGYTQENWFFEVAKNILCPDITFLATVPSELAIERIKSRPEERDRYLDEALLRAVSDNFIHMAKRASFTVLDTTQNADAAFETVKNELYKRGLIK